MHFGMILAPFWEAFGSILGAKMFAKCLQGLRKTVQNGGLIYNAFWEANNGDHNSNLSLFGSFWDPFWHQLFMTFHLIFGCVFGWIV